jgi:hypothetical protein
VKDSKVPKASKTKKKKRNKEDSGFNITLYMSACLKVFGKCSSALKMQALKE